MKINFVSIRKQKGAALLLFFIALILVAMTFILTSLPNNIKLKQQDKTSLALSKAKQALIAYAVSNYYRTNLNTGTNLTGWHGYLPCPESRSGSEGSQDANCNAVRINALGRLPWKTLNIEPLKDASGQCLWYAVSAVYKFGPKQLHNADSLGMFDVYDTQENKLNSDRPEDRIVAIVFSPGKQLGSQNRGEQDSDFPCGNPQDKIQAADYLDSISDINNATISATADQIDRFVSLSSNTALSNFNDRIITITRDDIFKPITALTKPSQHTPSIRVNALQEQLQSLGSILAQCLVDYAELNSKHFPQPARIDMGSLITADDYRNNINYTIQSDNTNGYLGRLPIYISSSPLSDYCITQSLSTAKIRLWNDWKDQFFLVIGHDFSASSLISAPQCSASTCPTLLTQNYAALIIIANLAINNTSLNQTRRDADIEPLTQNISDLKGNIHNYLEGVNATNAGADSLATYSTAIGNDIFIAIDTNLNIHCFNLNTKTTPSTCPTI